MQRGRGASDAIYLWHKIEGRKCLESADMPTRDVVLDEAGLFESLVTSGRYHNVSGVPPKGLWLAERHESHDEMRRSPCPSTSCCSRKPRRLRLRGVSK